MTRTINYGRLSTEQNNSRSRIIDRLSLEQAFKILNREDSTIPSLVANELKSIVAAVKMIVTSLRSGGRLFFFGAGTSGRLGILEAAECPPTFNSPPSLVQAFMAGGKSSVFRSKEGAEDRGQDSARLVQKHVKAGDVVVGIAASGVTAFVDHALRAARRKKAKTIFVTCNPQAPRNLANVTIAVKTGAEVIAGSTRLKAGTATKLVLNSLTVLSMIQLGKVYGNRMVDLQPKSKKLTARAIGLVSTLGNVSPAQAIKFFRASNGNAKTAILMAKKNISREQAALRLKKSGGHLHRALHS